MSLMLGPRAPYMHSLLPSSSLEGLEQVIPPEPNSPKIYIPRWKLDKPLPTPPERNSGIYSSDDYYLSSARYQRPYDRQRETGIYSRNCGPTHARSVDELRLFCSRQSPVPRSPHYQRISRNDQFSSLAKRARHSTEPIYQTHDEGSIKAHVRIDDKIPHKELKVPKPKRESISGVVKSANTTLITRIDESAESVEAAQPRTDTPEGHDNRDLCFCHKPHPRHSKTYTNKRSSKSSSSEGVQAGNLPDAASYIGLIRQQSAPDIPHVKIEEVPGGQLNSRREDEPPNRTQLYSFTTCASTSMIDEFPDTISRKESSGFGLFRSPPLPPARQENRHRPKQLAIPPSDYQLYGVKGMPKNKPKKKKSGLLPSYINKLIPKVIRRQTSEPQMQSLTTPQTAPPYLPGENPHRSREEWFGLGKNINAWRSTIEFSRDAFGSNANRAAEQKRKEELKNKIVMVGPTPHWL
ncbi:uncharacterized protein GIQ15_04358 [Arthroderma uncinatum]|uniref:uncharacterized protein n=1 Tax=Arthroderma uncinatum TaxID=74035 RepID=UPI00144AF501|nr:uncharacterized protein GIQ15_04358 [Arthroderma uncinatum]KAF3481599.1 hypothetical protein GIQ15_04358 [Arthroderma uncinatum]